MFSDAAKLPNVSLPIGFWNVLKLQNVMQSSIFYCPKTLYEELVAEFKYGDKKYYWRVLQNSPFVHWFKRKDSLQTYLVNCDTEQVVEMIDAEGVVKIFSREDTDFRVVVSFKSVDDPFHEDYYRLANSIDNKQPAKNQFGDRLHNK